MKTSPENAKQQPDKTEAIRKKNQANAKLTGKKQELPEQTNVLRTLPALFLLLLLAVVSFFYLNNGPRRYAVFAAYSADGEVRPYILRYLKELKKITDGVIFVSDCAMSENAKKKLAPYIMHGEFERHNEYDWGSYKRGFLWLQEKGLLKYTDELIFANDSTYAPMTSFKPMFKQMSVRKELDFWGNTSNTTFNPHLQSYFLVFRKPVINSKSFASFLKQVEHQPYSSMYVTEYEIKLTPYLENMGYKWDSYIPDYSKRTKESDPNSYPLDTLGQYHSQFLKRRLFNGTLLLLDDISELLQWLKKHSPKTYRFIQQDFPQISISTSWEGAAQKRLNGGEDVAVLYNGKIGHLSSDGMIKIKAEDIP